MKVPFRGSSKAAAYDVYVTEIEHIDEKTVLCKLGFGLEFNDNFKANLIPRSSFTKYNWIMNNSPGTCDADYRGEYMMKFKAIPTGVQQIGTIYLREDTDGDIDSTPLEFKLTYDEFPYKVGERVGQITFSQYAEVTEWNETNLSNTERAEKGFGSTGNK